MGNRIASSFVQRLRRSSQGTTLVSQTSANPPLFLDPDEIPGIVRAFVVFDGFASANTACTIIKKSTNVVGVTSRDTATRGDYEIEFQPNTFSNRDYTVVGSVYADSTQSISAANTFFVKGSGYSISNFVVAQGIQQSETRINIQTVNLGLTGIPAFAKRVSLLFYR